MIMSIGALFLKRTAILCAAFFSVAAAAAEKVPQHFKPSGPWAMEYADEGCRLIRNFSDGKTELTLAFERFSLGLWLRLGLTGTDLRFARSGSDLEYRYGDAKVRRSEVLDSVLADGRSAILVPEASLIDPKETSGLVGAPLPDILKAETDTASRISTVTFFKGYGTPIALDVGSMAAPMKAMQRCVDDLVTSWGVDIARLVNSKQPAKPMNDPVGWVAPRDYPPTMLKAGLGGLVRVRLVIGENGAIDKCMVEVSKPGDFEKLVCGNIVKRAKFTPALDAEGKPMRSYWTRSWRFSTF
jgi:hypothetical protein